MDWRDDELDHDLHEGLHDAFSVEFAEEEFESQSGILTKHQAPVSIKERRLLLLALVLSLCVHAALATWVLGTRLSLQEDELPDFVEIQLIPSNPLLAEELVEEVPLEESEEIEETSPEPVEEPVEVAEVEAVSETEEVLEEIPAEPLVEVTENLEQSELIEAEELINPPLIEVPEVFVPSIVNVRESINVIEQQTTTQLWSYDCDTIEEESELRRCKPTDRRNYAVIERNNTYQALNPVRELSRGLRTLPTVTSNAPALASRLRTSDLPEGLSDYVMEQVEAGITHNTNPGNRVIENMEIMIENEAAATKRWIMNNPWVLNREKEIEQRQVHAQ